MRGLFGGGEVREEVRRSREHQRKLVAEGDPRRIVPAVQVQLRKRPWRSDAGAILAHGHETTEVLPGEGVERSIGQGSVHTEAQDVTRSEEELVVPTMFDS